MQAPGRGQLLTPGVPKAPLGARAGLYKCPCGAQNVRRRGRARLQKPLKIVKAGRL